MNQTPAHAMRATLDGKGNKQPIQFGMGAVYPRCPPQQRNVWEWREWREWEEA